MCLIALAWRAHPGCRLALIANRDEFHARPAAPAGFHPGQAEIYGGRDLQAGGSWLLASTRGRLAAVTNVRAGVSAEAAPRSRGKLVAEFTAGDDDAPRFAATLRTVAPSYGRFNLLLWDGERLVFASNYPVFAMAEIAPGLHAVSNGPFDAAWPKSTHATDALRAWLDADGPASAAASHDAGTVAFEPLYDALADRRIAPDALLPGTGIGRALERKLSPAFIHDPVYGTRCSTIVLVGEDGNLHFAERRYDANGDTTGTTDQRFRWAV